MASIEITIKFNNSCYTFIINIIILKYLNVLFILEEHQEGRKLVFVINTNFTSLYFFIGLWLVCGLLIGEYAAFTTKDRSASCANRR